MASRDPTDVEELIAHAAGLRRLAVRLVGENDADDVIQDAVVAGIGGAPSEPHAWRSWFVRVVRNISAGKHRAEGRRTDRERVVARPESSRSTGEMVERMELQRIVAEEVLRLDEPFRSAVLALHFEGDSAEDYARRIGVPSATVRTRSKRGLDTLRTRLDKRFGGERSAWSACLLSLARPENVLVPAAIVGGLVMKKMLVAAAFALLAAFLAWSLFGRDSRENPRIEVAERTQLDLSAPNDIERVAELAPVLTEDTRHEIATPTEPSSESRVFGRVVRLPGREPAVGIGVRLAPDGYRPELGEPPLVLTDADGRYSIDVPRPGWFDLGFDRATHSRRVGIPEGKSLEVDLELPRGVDLVGRVLALDGTPVADAEVRAQPVQGQWSRCLARTAADGSYAILGVSCGVFARAEGHSPSGCYGLNPAGLSSALDLYLGGAAGRLEGRLLDSEGNPLPGIRLAAGLADSESMTDPAGVRTPANVPERDLTDAQGEFAFESLRPGRTVVEVHARNNAKFSVVFDVRAEQVTRGDITMPPRARLFGRVTNTKGEPVPGAYVDVYGEHGTNVLVWTITNADGRYDDAYVPAGRVRMVARSGQVGNVETESELAPGEQREWSPVLGRPSVIRGRVVDFEGRGLAGVEVTCSPGKGTEALTDASGRFELISRWSRLSTVVARNANGDRAEMWGVDAEQGDIVIVLAKKSAVVRGRLVDSAGILSATTSVSCQGRNIPVEEGGRFEFTGLAHGVVDLYVYAHPAAYAQWHLLRFELEPGEVRDLGDVLVPATGSFVVESQAHAGVDPPRVEFRAHRIDIPLQIYVSADRVVAGQWREDVVPAGDYRVIASGGGVALAERTLTIRAGETTTFEFELHAGKPVRIEPRGDRLTTWRVEVRDQAGARIGGTDRALYTPTCSVVSLRPGTYEIEVEAADGRKGSARVTVRADEEREQYVPIEVR